jgi:hypothetical protein
MAVVKSTIQSIDAVAPITKDMSKRQSKGSPKGGQFMEDRKPESGPLQSGPVDLGEDVEAIVEDLKMCRGDGFTAFDGEMTGGWQDGKIFNGNYHVYSNGVCIASRHHSGSYPWIEDDQKVAYDALVHRNLVVAAWR